MSDTFAQHSVEISRLNRAIEARRKAEEHIKKCDRIIAQVVPLAFPVGTIVLRKGAAKPTKPTKRVVIGYGADGCVKCYPFEEGGSSDHIQWAELIREQDAGQGGAVK